ncbi:Cytochrome P450 monooxygenase FCK2 [Fusarium oxysporum f. sp. albedinis]|nr:Cytochrome P450 monooxygenase FCK2 [Fusarium oxysporum f. sp. albedinis]
MPHMSLVNYRALARSETSKIWLPGPALSTDFARLSNHLDLVERLPKLSTEATGLLDICQCGYICNEFKFNRASSEPMKELPTTIDQDGIGPCFDTIRPQQLTDNTKSFTS